ncbi:MAG: NAD(P)/FAD-dependent oxidoreductase [Firmicutes bacterium]|nr:NAD(P)/FAD-dependent oxidoreductase [Bacillota bacterium]
MGYKVAIAGAGPGGAVLARKLAEEGIDVTIYEKGEFEQLGHDWSDAVERVALEAIGIEMPVLVGNRWQGALVKEHGSEEGLFEPHAIPRLKLFSPDYSSVKEIEFRMITTDRQALGKMLVQQAVDAGAEIKYGCEVLRLLYRESGTNGPDGVDVYGLKYRDLTTGDIREMEADIVVESSGYKSVLRRSLPPYTGLADEFKDSAFGFVNREVRVRDPELAKTDIIADHYRYGFHTGYQWSHIHNEERIDVGAGVRHDPANPDPKDLIEDFIARHASIRPEMVRGGRRLCIVGRPLLNFATNGFLVIGDAASTSVPTTGCGAGSAMLVGLWAAEVIASAAREGRHDLGKLWEINKKFYLDHDRGASFAALSALRTALQDLGHDNLNFLFRKDIMNREMLEDAVNGKFNPPGLDTRARSLLHGIFRPSVLLKMNKTVAASTKIYDHYKNYPPIWDPRNFERWRMKTEKLFRDY